MRATKLLFSAFVAGDVRGFLGDLLGGLIGYRFCCLSCYLLCGNLVGYVKDHNEPASDLRVDIGGLRINLIVDLLLACRSICYLALPENVCTSTYSEISVTYFGHRRAPQGVFGAKLRNHALYKSGTYYPAHPVSTDNSASSPMPPETILGRELSFKMECWYTQMSNVMDVAFRSPAM
jgi:hypothetical protein